MNEPAEKPEADDPAAFRERFLVLMGARRSAGVLLEVLGFVGLLILTRESKAAAA